MGEWKPTSKKQYVTECIECGSVYNPAATLCEGRKEYPGCIGGGELLDQSSANGICSMQLELQILELIRMSSGNMTGYGESLLLHIDTK